MDIEKLTYNLDNCAYLLLEHGVLSRGEACDILEIDRADLDGWMMEQRMEIQEKHDALFKRLKLLATLTLNNQITN
jgi:hypothetical protein